MCIRDSVNVDQINRQAGRLTLCIGILSQTSPKIAGGIYSRRQNDMLSIVFGEDRLRERDSLPATAVSYTHLDVYKRQC